MCTTETTIAQLIDYLSKRDLQNLVNLFSENIQWEVPGDTKKVPWLGKRNSKGEIEEFFKVLWKSTQPLSADIHKIFIVEEQAVITGQFSTRILRTNKVVDSMFFIHLVIANQKIVTYKLLEDSFAVSKALD